MRIQTQTIQAGISLTGLIFVLGILALIAVFAMKVFPSVSEYMAIEKAIVVAKNAPTAREVQTSFDKQAEVNYITSITGKDLEIVKSGNDMEVSFAYEKKISLVGPVSLLIEYKGSTAKEGKQMPRKME